MRLLIKFYLMIVLLVVCASSAWATDVTISSQTLDGYPYSGLTAKLKIYYSLTFNDSLGVRIMGGAVGGSGFYRQVDCTVDQSLRRLSIPSFTIPSTTDSSNPEVTVTAVIYDAGGSRRDFLFANWQIPPLVSGSPPGNLTIEQLRGFNDAPPEHLPPGYLTTEQANQYIASALGSLNYSSESRLGITALTVAPALSSFPIAVGANDPLVNQIYNVKSYGATCNNIANDAAGIAAAKAALDAAGGGTLYFPSNKCKTDTQIVVTSNMHVRGEGLSYPNPSASQYVSVILGGTIIHYTGSTSLFLITDNTIDYSIESLGAYTDNPAAVGILLRNTSTVSSLPAQQGKFSDLQFWGFARAFDLDANTIEWQCDSIQVENFTANNCDQCIYLNSQNDHNIRFTKTKVSPNASGVGVYIQKSAPIAFDTISGETLGGASLFYFGTASHNIVDINNANAETFTRFLDTVSGSGELRYAIAIRNSLIEQPIRFQLSATVMSENNTYWGAGYFTSTGLATDMRVFSRNDTVQDGNGGARLVASPFYIGTALQMAGNSCVDEDNWYRSHKGCAGQGVTTPYALGAGFTTPAIPAQNLDVRSDTSIQARFGNTAGSAYFNLGRSTTSGYLEVAGNQTNLSNLRVKGNDTTNQTDGIVEAQTLVILPVVFSKLGTPGNGVIKYCSDCLAASSPCAGAGLGAWAFRQGGAWKCL